LDSWAGFSPTLVLTKRSKLLAILGDNNSSDGFLLSFVIILVGIAITAIGVLGIYADAGKLGLLVVGCAYISGLIMPSGNLTVIGAFLLIGAVLLGPVVYDAHNN